MNNRAYRIRQATYLLIALVILPTWVFGDIIVLQTGKTIEAGETWEQGSNIQFYLEGTVVNVAKDDILRIEKTPGPPPPDPDSPTTEAESTPPPSSQKPLVAGDRPQTHPEATDNYQLRHFRIDPIGFRGLSWGEPLSEMKGLVKTGTSPVYGGVTEYIRPYDVLKVGNADVEKIVYGYAKGNLFTITIWTSGYANFKALQEETAHIFGPGKTVTRQNEYTLWSTDISNTMLVYYKSRGKGLLWMQSRNMDKQL